MVYDDYILIFSKNWVNNEVDLYAIPKIIGTHSAHKVSNYNVQGLVTGGDSVDSNKIYLSGYSSSNITPFLIEIYDLNISTPSNLDVFLNSNTVKLNIFLPFGNQGEGISFIESDGSTDMLYISNEKLVVSVLTFPSKLRELVIDNSTLSADLITKDEQIIIHPNPFINQITLTKIVDEIKIYNSIGSCVLSKKASDYIDTSNLSSGFYVISIQCEDHTITKKMIK